MAFPTTPILDDFNATALQALTARTGWGASVLATGAGYSTDAVPTLATSSAATGNYWNASSTDCECYCTVRVFDNVNDTMMVAARITATGGAWTGYAIASDRGTTTDFQIVKVVAGAVTVIGGLNPSTTVVPGDGVGISVIADVVTSWYRSGAGAWVQKDSVTDSSITGSGFIGGVIHQFANAHSFDDFGGGAPSGAPATLNLLTLTGVGT